MIEIGAEKEGHDQGREIVQGLGSKDSTMKGGGIDIGTIGIEKIEVDGIEAGITTTTDIGIDIMRSAMIDTEKIGTTKTDIEKIEVEMIGVEGRKTIMIETKEGINTNASIIDPIRGAKKVDLVSQISHLVAGVGETGVEVEGGIINRQGNVWLTMPMLNKANI